MNGRQPGREPARRPAWLPHPALSVLLAVIWLLLHQSAALPQLIAAVVIGLVVPKLVDGFIGPALYPRHPLTALRFTLLVLWDIVVSNVAVARIVLGPGVTPRPAWVPVPLDTEHPTAISLLASIITMTPGTVSCVIDEAQHTILVHALDCEDPLALAQQIKQRYEAPLRRIFEGVTA
jgi:multicomponent K+:H+ antiporter subunit E